MSGNFFLAEFRWQWFTLNNPIFKAFYRTVQYQKKGTSFGGSIRPVTETQTHFWFVLWNSIFGHGLVVKMQKKEPYDMELAYYTNHKETTGGNGTDFYEVTLPRPSGRFQGYEKIKPRIRKLGEAERLELLKDPDIRQAAWVFYPYWEDPVPEE